MGGCKRRAKYSGGWVVSSVFSRGSSLQKEDLKTASMWELSQKTDAT